MRHKYQFMIALVSVFFLAFAMVGTTRASVEPQIIDVTMKDYYIELSKFTLEPGKAVEFRVTNQGTVPHRFIVEPYVGASTTNEAESTVIATGTARTIRQTFQPGIYRVTCDKWDHAARGMVNAFAVETASQKTIPWRIDFIISLLGLVLGSAYILWDSLGLTLTPKTKE